MKINGIDFEGPSIAGEETNIRFHSLGFMFDIGKCPNKAVSIPILLISHGHPDHIGGIANYLFERSFKKLSPPQIIAPPSLIPHLKKITRCFASIHNSRYFAKFESLGCFKRKKLKKGLYVEAVPATHSIPSLCYSIFKTKNQCTPDLSYTGDTNISILDQFPHLYQSKILFLECTFFGSKKYQDLAHQKKHIHILHIFERAELFKNNFIVLTHPDPVFSNNKLHQILKKQTPKILKKRIIVNETIY